MSRETPESASSKKEAEKISVNREVLEYDTEAKRSAGEEEEKELQEKQEMEARAADERKKREIRENIEKMDGNLPLYRKDGRVCMPGADIEENTDGDGKKTEETSEEGSKSGKDVETTAPDDKEEKAQVDTEKADDGEANEGKNEKKDSEEIIPEGIGNDEAEKGNIEKIIPETDKAKKEKADAEVKKDDTKEKKDEEPKTGSVKESELSELDKEIHYTIKKLKKEEVTPITGEEEKKGKKEEKEIPKTKESEKEPDKDGSVEKKTEPEKVRTVAREKISIPESASSKVRKELTGEINDLWRVFQTGEVDEKARKTVEKYSVDVKDREKVYDRIVKLGGPQMVATGSDEMHKATKITEKAVESGDLYKMYMAGKMSESAVNTLATAMGAQIEMVRATKEQKKLLNRIIKGGSLGYDIREEKNRKQPEVGTFTHKLSASEEKALWNAAMSNTEKNNKRALEVLLGRTGRRGQSSDISKSEDFHMASKTENGRTYFDITWKDKDKKEYKLNYTLDGTALGNKAYKPGFTDGLNFRKKYPTAFTIVENGKGVAAENAEQTEPSVSENTEQPKPGAKEGSGETAGKYPKNAAFIAYYREIYKNAGEEYKKAADDLETSIGEGKKEEAKKSLEEFISLAGKALSGGGLGKKDKEDSENLLDMAKEALRELDKKKEDEEEKPERDGHPDALAMKDLEPGDEAVVRVNIKGKEEKRRYYMEDDGAVYMNRGNSTNLGKLGSDPTVDENVIIKKGVNGVVDIEVIRGKKEKDNDNEDKAWEKRKKELIEKYPKLKDLNEFSGRVKKSGKHSLILEEFYEKLNKNEKDALDAYLDARDYTGEVLFGDTNIESKFLSHITEGGSEKKPEDIKRLVKDLWEDIDRFIYSDSPNQQQKRSEREEEKGEDKQEEGKQTLNGNQIMEGELYKIQADGEEYVVYNTNGQLYFGKRKGTRFEINEDEFKIEIGKTSKIPFPGVREKRSDGTEGDAYFEKKIEKIEEGKRSDMK